jgi:hypothetical protein
LRMAEGQANADRAARTPQAILRPQRALVNGVKGRKPQMPLVSVVVASRVIAH